MKNYVGAAPAMNEPRKTFFSYFCNKCPALFKSSSDLAVHSKFHGSSSLPFACSQCDYRARNSPHLSKHATVHTPEYCAKRRASEKTASDATKEIPLVKKIDQMLLLEANELNLALSKRGEAARLLHKCLLCPALFIKGTTLTYHMSLHSSDGEFKCIHCDYAANRVQNLTAHAKIHTQQSSPKKKAPAVRKPARSFPCTKCPAVFYKQDRFDRHFDLHGKGYKFQCTYCDYSVRFAANLIRHRHLHTANPDSTPLSQQPDKVEATATTTSPAVSDQPYVQEEIAKTHYMCDRCPYVQSRKDAVQSHQRRHWYSNGFKCPYCDYSSMQSTFVHSHIKMHITPNGFYPPHAFIKFEAFKIFVKDEGEESLLYDDSILKAKKSRTTSTDSIQSDHKVPVVVLSDILSSEKEMEKWKIPKITSKKQPSLVVKISKVDNSKMYSVTSNGTENL